MSQTTAQHTYQVSARHHENRVNSITTPEVDPVLHCATPPDFPNGIPGVWSPETLFLAAISGCFVSTFQVFCDKFHLTPVSLTCAAQGSLGTVEGKLAFQEVTLFPVLTIANAEEEATAMKVLEKAHKYCLVSNSVQCPVSIQEQVVVG